MTSMMPSQQRFGAPTNNNPGQPARPRPQVGGDMQFAGGTPYFDERTGQARQPARQSGGMDMSAYRPGQAQSQQPSFGSDYNPNANMRLPGNFSQPPQQNAGRQPAFQMAPAQTPWGQSMDPFAERDAFVNQINQQRMQNQIAFNSGGPTNPVAGMNPGIDYQQAMQQAGLGGGAPSMAPDYGDSLIARLNQQFGGSSYQPPGNFGGLEAGMMQQLTRRRPPAPGQYVNQQGELFTGSMSFAPGTPQEYRDQAYGQYANRQGFFLQPQQAPPAYFPGFDPQTQNQFGQPVQAQPFPAGPAFSPQPAPGFGFNEGYGFGGPSLPQFGQPAMPATTPSRAPTIANDGKNPNRYDSGYPVGSEEWWQEASARNRAAAAAERPVYTPSREERGSVVDYKQGMTLAQQREAEAARRTSPPPARRLAPLPSNPRAAADAVRAAGGSRSEGNDAWRAAHNARINSQENRNWLASQSGSNRKIYQMLQQWG